LFEVLKQKGSGLTRAFLLCAQHGREEKVKVLWEAGRSDPHERQGDKPGNRSDREVGAERSR
jgi:hypothetical protein